MKRIWNCGKTLAVLVVLTAVAMTFACAPKGRAPISEMDTPAHHTVMGMRMLERGNAVEAAKEFQYALELDKRYAQAHAGLAVVKALQGEFPTAFQELKDAKRYAVTKEDKVAAYVAAIRVNTLNKADKEWLAKAREAYDRVVEIDPNAPAGPFFMGLAYKDALDFNQAGQMFARVLELKGDYVGRADAEWQLVQKIQRAMPGTEAGKRIAVRDWITRADAAALFMEELKIDVLYRKRMPKRFDTAFKDPEKAKAAAGTAILATDIADHFLKADIEGILRIGVRGLEVYPDGTFRPGEAVDRASYAMMIEDILVKLTGDESLATKYIGNPSPFPDLRSDLPYFNAVMVMTSRGIMEAVDITSGEFAPLRPIAGVDALLVIRKLKEELKF